MSRAWTWIGLSVLLACGPACEEQRSTSRGPQEIDEESDGEELSGAGSEGREAGSAQRGKSSIDVSVLEAMEEEAMLVLDQPPVATGEGDQEEAPEPSAHKLLAVKVKVTNNHKNLTVPVSPQRFQLEGKDGRRLLPLTAGGQLEPALNPCFLEGGRSVSGWLFFNVEDEKQGLAFLMANFRRPNLRIALSSAEETDTK